MGVLSIFKGGNRRRQNLENALTNSFGRIKSETSLIFSWLHYFRQKDKINDEIHNYAQRQLQSQSEKIGKLKDEIFAIKSEILQLKIGRKSTEGDYKTGSFPNLVRTKSGLESEPERQSKFEKNILAKIRPQRKEYIMEQIAKFIEKGAYSTKEIETVIVKEKALCGRTAFYDYLREMKHKKMIKYDESGRKRLLIMR